MNFCQRIDSTPASERLGPRLDAFAVDDDGAGDRRLREHRIETRKSLPFSQKAQPVPYANRIFIERELDTLFRLGIISVGNPGQGPYASPIVIVAKKD